ncbi:MAG: apolipoprotein N-acyltransferase [Akkermansia sp.]|nr:apolipoprotein N-acyltransferase [Akkermansia sp.]
MSNTPVWRHRALNCLASVAGGVFMAMAFPPYDIGSLVWVGLLPLLWVLWHGRRGFRRGALHGWLYGMGWYCTSFWWIHNVGTVWDIPAPVFLGVAFLPLMALYSCLPALWAGVANTLLRPCTAAAPPTDLPADEKREAWGDWAALDMRTTLRCALGLGALWPCIEWLRASGTLGFSWCSLGTALYDGLSMVQWAEFTGTHALSFIPVFTSVVLWCSFRRTIMHFRACAVGCRPWDFYGAVVFLMVLFSGGLWLSQHYAANIMLKRPEVLPLPVAAVQINLDQNERMDGGSIQPHLYGMYLRATKSAFDDIQKQTAMKAMENPDYAFSQQLPVWVVWPESAMGCPMRSSAETGKPLADPYTSGIFFGEEGLPMVRRLVKEMGGQDFVLFTGVDELLCRTAADGEPLVTPAGFLQTAGMSNSMAVFTGGLDSVTTHGKQHLMPFGEYIPWIESIDWIGKAFSEITGTQVGDHIIPGTGSAPLEIPVPGTDESVGVIPAVCYEDTVASQVAKFARPGAQVIVNGSNDAWFRESACGEQQARAAAFRCIELRRPMVRAANMGVTCAIGPNGSFIHSLRKADGDPHLDGYSYAVLPVDREAGLTLYAEWGDWAVVLCLLLALGACAPALRRRAAAGEA